MRTVDLVKIAGCLAVLLACPSEPVVGHGAEAVPVAPRDAPSPGQPSNPGGETYGAGRGDGHETFGADALLRVERSGETRALARWDLDAIAAIPDREGRLLRKADDEAKGSVAFGSRESGAPPRLALTTGGQEGMPASPPDSFPSAIYDDSTNIVEHSPCSDSPFMRSIVTVVFVEGTTPGQRQAAVDHVNGTVVGGVPISERGIYLIQVDDDGTGAGVCAAEAALEELPTVAWASPDDIAEVDFRRPEDGMNGREGRRDTDAGPQETPAIQPSIRDGAHDGPEGFYFLPPLVEEPTFEGTFDPDRSPTVEICELAEAGCGAVVAEFTRETDPGSETVRVDEDAEQYVVDWHTDQLDLEAGQVYRIRVLLEDREAGHADVVAVTSGEELKNADTSELIPLKDGRTLPIKFRIEEELVLEFTVPAVTPDGVPDSTYDAENVIAESPIMSGTFLRNIVLVAFRDGATQAERQEAVDLVDGEVVGGVRAVGDDGFYFVRIEDDGTAGPLFEAIETLQALPQVVSASAEHLAPTFDLYRRPTDGSGSPSVQPSLRDGAHDGPEGFYFLPPLVEEPTFEGTFDPDRSPTVEICELAEEGCGAQVATFTRDTGPGSETVRVDEEVEHYVVNWHTDEFDLEAGQVYRIRVLLENREAGHADVVAVTSGKEMKNAETGETIALKDGRTLPVKFRIEEELVLEFTVPAVAPDTLPEGLYSSENIRRGSACGTLPMLRGIVVVTFEEGTTQAEKQQAVDLVDGEVIGGLRPRDDIEGYYYVRVEESPDGQVLCDAAETLNDLPQVGYASGELLGTNFYRRPDDGDEWSEDQWEPDPVGAHGERAQDDVVPEEAPDTVPEGLYSSENIRRGSACVTGRMLRGIVVVTFEEGTTRAEKQEAIDLVDGEVIGGSRPRDDLEGHYYVRVDDDSEGRVLCEAVETLNELPQVVNATEELFGTAFYRRPDDGERRREVPREPDPVPAHGECAQDDVVPVEAPDSVPEWFSDPELVAPCEGVMTGTCLVNVVKVRFVRDASRAERQVAIDAVQGEVVGGTGAFIYYVRVPHDGTTEPLRQAIRDLRAFSYVRYAGGYSKDPPVPDRPRPDGDGGG